MKREPLFGSSGPEPAKPYEELRSPPSEAELLLYINHKLGYTNALLEKIHYWLQFLGGSIIAVLLYFFAIKQGWVS